MISTNVVIVHCMVKQFLLEYNNNNNNNNNIYLCRANSTLQFSNAPYNKRTVYYKYMPGILHFIPRKYMLLAGWEVRIGKNCDGGLENAGPRAAFFKPEVTVFSYTDRP